jgi:Leucine-rich repeat (LRR) protein
MAGISLILQNNPTVTQINCGTTSPRLGGTISLSAFPNLQEFYCNNNDITAISGYENNSNLRVIQFFDNKVTGSISSLSNLTQLGSFFCGQNLLVGPIPSLNASPNLTDFRCEANQLSGSIPTLPNTLAFFSCYLNYLTGSIPSLPPNIVVFQCQVQLGNTKLTGPIPSLNASPNLLDFRCGANQLTGPIPSLSGLSNLQNFDCFSNQLTGSIPSLNGLENLQNFNCGGNQFSGSIPSLSGLSKLVDFRAPGNQLTGFDGGPVSNTLNIFRVQNNQLTQSAVNTILATFVAAGKIGGSLNLGGTNASPTGGVNNSDKLILEGRGWLVTVTP